MIPRFAKVRTAILCTAALAAGLAAGFSLRDGGGAAAQEDAAALAEAQLTRFYEALAGRADLGAVLGDALQIARTDGTRYDRAAYLASPPSLSQYELNDLVAFRSGDVLTATYYAGVTGTVGGTGVASEDQPRLAVFARTDGVWKLQALANLGMGLMSDPAAEGRKAVEAWVGAVASGDITRVEAVLAPEFQIVRADGTAYGAEAYLQSDLPVFPEPPQIDTLVVTGYGDHLIARYEIVSRVLLGAEKELPRGPRLTVFRKGRDGQWLVVAHANFAAIVR
jgi:ketosteroid isomerase-like protein